MQATSVSHMRASSLNFSQRLQRTKQINYQNAIIASRIELTQPVIKIEAPMINRKLPKIEILKQRSKHPPTKRI